MAEVDFGTNTVPELALLEASVEGDTQRVTQLLDQGVSVNTEDVRGSPWCITPLMWAALGGHVSTMKILLQRGADIARRDKNFPGEGGGETALHYAARGGSVRAVELLVEHKAVIDAVSRSGTTPLSEAVYEKNSTTVERLLKLGANPNVVARNTVSAPLHCAVFKNDLATIQVLLNARAKVDIPSSTGTTPLSLAANEGREAIVKAFLDAGADVNAADRFGWTCLMNAVVGRKPSIVARFIMAGADLNAVDAEGLTALAVAERDGLRKIAAILRNAGARPTEPKSPRAKRK
jgi:uncharacterized protein